MTSLGSLPVGFRRCSSIFVVLCLGSRLAVRPFLFVLLCVPRSVCGDFFHMFVVPCFDFRRSVHRFVSCCASSFLLFLGF